MATAKPSDDDITECPICTEVYTDPRVLPWCYHIFCLKCIKTWSKDKLPGDVVTCPFCRGKFTLSTKGVSNLPKKQGYEAFILSAITTLKQRLPDFINPDFGLLYELLRLEVLTRRECDNVRRERTVYHRNDALLELLTSKGQCGKFLKALQRTGQQHVVNFVIQSGEITEFGDNRPLDEAHMRRLDINGVQLLDRIDANHIFVTELANVGCITWKQREHIINIIQPRDRNDKLLEFITRRSIADFQQFISVLAKEQSHLVPLLVTDGVVADADAEQEELSVNDVIQYEDRPRIVSRSEVLLPVGSQDRIQHKVDELNELLLSEFGCKASHVVTRPAKSLALHFICITLSAAMNLHDQCHNKQLKSLCTSTLGATCTVKRVTWPPTDFARCSKYFSFVQVEQDDDVETDSDKDGAGKEERDSSETDKLSNLPLELSETVLTRTFVMLYLSNFEGSKSSSAKHQAFDLQSLASVCWYWRNTLTDLVRGQLKRLIKRFNRSHSSSSFQPSSVEMQHVYDVTVSEQESEDVYLLTRMSLSCTIVAVTSLLDEIYVITENSDTVYVYFCHRPYELEDSVSIPEMNPADIATSYTDVCVYILDSNNVCLWRIYRNLTTKKYPLDVRPGESLSSMSITRKGVIVVVQTGNSIVMYNPRNGEIKHVPLEGLLEATGKCIVHATEIGENRLLACHDTQTFVITYDLKLANVCNVMDSGGNHIALMNNKCAVVADKTGRMVRMLDIDEWKIKNQWKLSSERRGTENPSHVHYSKENQLLFFTWLSYLGVYSFDDSDRESYLAAGEIESRQQQESDYTRETADLPAATGEPCDSNDVRMLLERLSTNYEGQFYYDMKDNTVHVAVPEDVRQVVTKEVEEYKRKTFFQYQIETPVESCCESTNLRAGSVLLSLGDQRFMFSGSVIDERTGITVAHAVNAKDIVLKYIYPNPGAIRQAVGRCRATFRDVQITTERSECTRTADVAVLELLENFHVPRNLIRWPNGGEEYRVKIYRGRIERNTKVMVLDQNGKFRSGVIRRELFTDTSLETTETGLNVFGVLGIGTQSRRPGLPELAITCFGDSGALVLSEPGAREGNFEEDVLYVYGMVIALYSWPVPSRENSLTVANSLSEVIPKIFDSGNVINPINIPVDDIDFTEFEEKAD